MADMRAFQNLTIAQLCDRFAERDVSFPSFRVEVKRGPPVFLGNLNFEKGKINLKLN
jgi:hypothetical protein